MLCTRSRMWPAEAEVKTDDCGWWLGSAVVWKGEMQSKSSSVVKPRLVNAEMRLCRQTKKVK